MRKTGRLGATVLGWLCMVSAAHAVCTPETSALESRVAIEQAKGILAERLGLDVEAAFEVLRRQAREQRRPISEVAGGVVVSSRRSNA